MTLPKNSLIEQYITYGEGTKLKIARPMFLVGLIKDSNGNILCQTTALGRYSSVPDGLFSDFNSCELYLMQNGLPALRGRLLVPPLATQETTLSIEREIEQNKTKFVPKPLPPGTYSVSMCGHRAKIGKGNWVYIYPSNGVKVGVMDLNVAFFLDKLQPHGAQFSNVPYYESPSGQYYAVVNTPEGSACYMIEANGFINANNRGTGTIKSSTLTNSSSISQISSTNLKTTISTNKPPVHSSLPNTLSSGSSMSSTPSQTNSDFLTTLINDFTTFIKKLLGG
ncbi:MAG: hypothetical protein QXU98_08045 [Candidatus Parvarchaeota archaeon]